MAIALSQSEAEEKEKQKLRSTSQILNKTCWCLLHFVFSLIRGLLLGKRAKKSYDLKILVVEPYMFLHFFVIKGTMFS